MSLHKLRSKDPACSNKGIPAEQPAVSNGPRTAAKCGKYQHKLCTIVSFTLHPLFLPDSTCTVDAVIYSLHPHVHLHIPLSLIYCCLCCTWQYQHALCHAYSLFPLSVQQLQEVYLHGVSCHDPLLQSSCFCTALWLFCRSDVHVHCCTPTLTALSPTLDSPFSTLPPALKQPHLRCGWARRH